MSGQFDPYHKWLGIPPHEQPADLYRLLGIARFESDADVIRHAVERQTAYVQLHARGEHRDVARRVVGELARAKAVLLDHAQRARYDNQLRAADVPGQLESARPAKPEPPAKARVATPFPSEPQTMSAPGPPKLPVSLAPTLPPAPAARQQPPEFQDAPASRSSLAPIIWVFVGVTALVSILLACFIIARLGRHEDRDRPQTADASSSHKTNDNATDHANGNGQPANGRPTAVRSNNGTRDEFQPHEAVPANGATGRAGEDGTPVTTTSPESQPTLDDLRSWQTVIEADRERLQPELEETGPQERYRCLKEMRGIYDSDSCRKAREFDFSLIPQPKSQTKSAQFVKLVRFKTELKSFGDQIQTREDQFVDYRPFSDEDWNAESEIELPYEDVPVTAVNLRLLDPEMLDLTAHATPAGPGDTPPLLEVKSSPADETNDTWSIVARPAPSGEDRVIGRCWLASPDYETELVFEKSGDCPGFKLQVSVASPLKEKGQPFRSTIVFRPLEPIVGTVDIQGATFFDAIVPTRIVSRHGQSGGQVRLELKCPHLKGGQELVMESVVDRRARTRPAVSNVFWNRETKHGRPTEIKYQLHFIEEVDGFHVDMTLLYGAARMSLDQLAEAFEQEAAVANPSVGVPTGGSPPLAVPGALPPGLEGVSPKLVDEVIRFSQGQLRKVLHQPELEVDDFFVQRLLLERKRAIEADPDKYASMRLRLTQQFAEAVFDHFALGSEIEDVFLEVYKTNFCREMRKLKALDQLSVEMIKRIEESKEQQRQREARQFYDGLVAFKKNPHVTGCIEWRSDPLAEWNTLCVLQGRPASSPASP